MPLTDALIRNSRPQAKPQKLYDSNGLYLLLNPNGSRWFRFKYRIGGVEKGLSLGVYPETSLKQARDNRDDARALLKRGIDPSAIRKSEKVSTGDSFSAVAAEYFKVREHELSANTLRKAKQQLRDLIEPAIGAKSIRDIAAMDLLKALRRIEESGALETTRKTKELCGRIFRYGVGTGRADRDPTSDLRGLLKPPITNHRPAITDPRGVGALMRAIDGYAGQPATVAALRLAPHVFLRPGELRSGLWSEIDFDAAEWRVPASRMKMKRPHIVPLSKQAIQVLKEIHSLTGNHELMFPAIGSRARSISENTLNAALRRLGYSGKEMVAHGFRSIASTLLNELGFAPDVIELQLAHKDKDQVRAAYNRSERLADRRKLMQAWSDHLDTLRADTKGLSNTGSNQIATFGKPTFGT